LGLNPLAGCHWIEPTAASVSQGTLPPRVAPAVAAESLPARSPAASIEPSERDHAPISLPAALALATSHPWDVQIAETRIQQAAAQRERAEWLWLPHLQSGVDYFRHDGQIQDIVGTVFTTSRTSLLLGAGPMLTLPTSEALYAPLAARQVEAASRAMAQATRDEVTLSVAIAYMNVQQSRGEVAAALETLTLAEDLVRRVEKLAPDLAPEVEIDRSRAEQARRRIQLASAHERWRVASADLARILRLPATFVLEPIEPPTLQIPLVDPNLPTADLIAIGLTYRPELASHQALVQAALARVRQERERPWWPTVAMRGVGSNTPGLAGGFFGGGINDQFGQFGPRFSVDLQAVWELQNLGLGNRAQVRERQAEQQRAFLELQRTQEQIQAEVVQAQAQAAQAEVRRRAAQDGLQAAQQTARKNLEGLAQTKRLGEALVLVFRPAEAVAAITQLDLAYRDWYQATADVNRAQFRLYRALGHPAEALSALCETVPSGSAAPEGVSTAPPIVTNPTP
jgi:outer membrane protein TolC